jgi:hypothetical protein
VKDPNDDEVTVSVTPPAGIETSLSGLLLDAYPDYSVSGAQTIAFTLTDEKGLVNEASLATDIAPLKWLERKTWTNEGPVAREHGALVVDAAAKRILLFGGSGYSPQGTPLDDSWQFDLVSETWTELTPTGDVPPGGGSRRVAQVPGQSVAYLFGGYGQGFANFDDLYRLDYSSGSAAFTELTQNNPPPARSLHGFAVDGQTQRLFAFAVLGPDPTICGLRRSTATPRPGPRSAERRTQPALRLLLRRRRKRGPLVLFSGATSGVCLTPRATPGLRSARGSADLTLLLEGDAARPDVATGASDGSGGPRLFVRGTETA